MGHITKIAAIETTSVIWKYDPSLLDNNMLGGLLNVISAIHTVAIKICHVFDVILYSLSFPLDSNCWIGNIVGLTL
jgi:hypothetical protein